MNRFAPGRVSAIVNGEGDGYYQKRSLARAMRVCAIGRRVKRKVR
jgi:hypothetical protein